MQVGSWSGVVKPHDRPKRFLLVLLFKDQIIRVINLNFFGCVWVVAQLFGHFARFLNSRWKDVVPIVFIGPQSIVFLPFWILFWAILIESSECYSGYLWTILHFQFHHCARKPHSVKGINLRPYVKAHSPIVIFGPLPKFIKEGWVLDGSGIFGVVIFEDILFVLFFE